jgi:hypothetical protein
MRGLSRTPCRRRCPPSPWLLTTGQRLAL